MFVIRDTITKMLWDGKCFWWASKPYHQDFIYSEAHAKAVAEELHNEGHIVEVIPVSVKDTQGPVIKQPEVAEKPKEHPSEFPRRIFIPRGYYTTTEMDLPGEPAASPVALAA